ncbi:MAG: hypothetical protein ABSD20_09775 [Terriglobales bacterium]|jgi:hypothetical protein
MRRRTIRLIAAVALVAVAIAVAFILRKRAAPEPARLLPEANAYVYVNLKPLRQLGIIGDKAPPARDPDYETFVRESGFQFERDLDEAAFAIHSAPRLVDAEPGSGQPEAIRRYSEVFRGHFDSRRGADYLRKIAKSTEKYRDVEIFSIPLEGRTARVALLGVGIAAVSNTDGPQVIRSMVDRYKELALPFGGPTLVRKYYRRVPFGSLLWGIAAVGSGDGGNKETPLTLPGGYDLFFPSNTVLVGSVRYLTSIQLRAEAFAENPEQAKRIADQVEAFLGIFHSLEDQLGPGGGDQDVKAVFSSLHVQLYKSRAILEASIPPAFLKKIFAEPPTQEFTGPPAPEPLPAPALPKPHKHRK